MEKEEKTQATPVMLSPEEAAQREAKARRLVKVHAFVTILAGLLPIPFLDLLAISIIQGRMLKKLGELYGHSFAGEQRRLGLTGVLIGGIALPVLLVPLLGSTLKLIPVIGTLAGIIAILFTIGPVSYGLGLAFIQHFEAGGTLLSLNPTKMRKVLRDYYEQGKSKGEAGEASKAAAEATS